MIGATIDQYKITQVLGKDTEGELYLASQVQTGEKFLVKAVSPALLAEPGFKERFMEDAVRLIKLNHPNITPLTNILDQDGNLYTVQEYIEGQTLEDRLKTLSPGQALPGYVGICKGILKGLGYVHAEGVVHRFMNPRYVILTPDGGVKIVGFGQVLQAYKEKRRGRARMVGEAHYFSPERFLNPDTTDTRSNLYAFGVMLYQMTTGVLPYEDGDYKELYKKHAAQPIPDPKAKNAELDPMVSELVKKVLAKKPEGRYQNAVEMHQQMNLVADSDKNAPGFQVEELTFDDPDTGFDLNIGSDSGFIPAADDAEFGAGDGGFSFDDDGNVSGSGGSSFSDTGFDSEPVVDDDPFGFGDKEAETESSFDFGLESAQGNDNDFGLGGGSLEDAFGVEASASMNEVESGGGFDFGMDSPADSSADDFGFGAESATSSLDLGGDLGDTAGDDDDFGFGLDETKGNTDSGAGDGFDFGSEPADSDFGLGNDGGFDFGSGEDDQSNFGSSGSGNDDFNFDEEPTAAAGLDGAMDDFGLGDSNQGGGDLGFSGIGGNDQDADDDFGLGDVGSSDGGDEFGFGGLGDGGGDSTFEFGDTGSSQSSDDEFDFGDSLDDLGAASGAADSLNLDGPQVGSGMDPNDTLNQGPSKSFDFGDANSEDPFGFGEGLPDHRGPDEFELSDAPGSAGSPEVGSDGFGVSDDEDAFGLSDDPGGDDAFTFGGEDPFEGGEIPDHQKETYFGTADAPESAEEDPFGELRDQTIGDDSKEKSASGFTTDDGAFSFESMGDEDGFGEQPAGGARMDMEESFAEAEKNIASEPVEVKRVKKIDKKVLGITIGLAAVIIAAIGFWFVNRQNKQKQADFMAQIDRLEEGRKYDNAISQISTWLLDDAQSDFAIGLKRRKDRIIKKQEEAAEQVKTLFERARSLEDEGNLLTDGKNDAIGAYLTILTLEPGNTEAATAAANIRKNQVEQADQLLEEGSDLEALTIFNALLKADKNDTDVILKQRELKTRLQKERAGELEGQINKLVAAQNYSPVIPLIKELEQITPESKYIKQTRQNLIDAFIQSGQDFVAKEKYGQAENAYRNALELDPQNKRANEAMKVVNEERIKSAIASTQLSLERAIARKDLEQQYRYAQELKELDSSNEAAKSAIQDVIKQLDVKRTKAEELRKVGQFKEVAAIYKEIYDIDGDEQTRELWRKYDRWSPPTRMAFVPIGKFDMGDNKTTGARPRHTVSLPNYFIDKYEVTNREFKEFVDANPTWRPGRIDAQYHDGDYLKHWTKTGPKADDLDRPVTHVSWFAADAYAKWKGKRLPTEAEWEKAAAGNTKGLKYWWGNFSDAKQAVYEFYPEKQPAPVGKFPANGYGIHEILGNVNEWVQDTYNENFYNDSIDAENPVYEGPGDKVLRGGSFKNRGRDLVLYLRFHKDPRLCNPTIGFRCAKDAGSTP